MQTDACASFSSPLEVSFSVPVLAPSTKKERLARLAEYAIAKATLATNRSILRVDRQFLGKTSHESTAPQPLDTRRGRAEIEETHLSHPQHHAVYPVPLPEPKQDNV